MKIPLWISTIGAAVLLTACGGGENGLPPATITPLATPTPTPAPIPFAQIVLSGSGAQVTGKFDLPSGNYRVSWTAHSTSDFHNIIAYMVGQDKTLLMATQDLNGSTLFQSAGGTFFVEVDAEGVAWRIVIDAI